MSFKASLAEALARTDALEAETGPLRGLADLANGKNDLNMTLETFAIAAMFDRVLKSGEHAAGPMTRGRYRWSQASRHRVDAASAGWRSRSSTSTLAKRAQLRPFPVARPSSLRLPWRSGLPMWSRACRAKYGMDTIFIDEGFGSLNSENGAGTLDQVLQVLSALTKGNRAVGLISHVGLVQEAIPQGFYVRSTPSGSRVEKEGGCDERSLALPEGSRPPTKDGTDHLCLWRLGAPE
ncbi:hypothetical protein [Paracoccus sp. (in: a-proteobacteria)]|uniref:hypothetical protein n=1 Tax=Paracoccus sp. TaxID=267 RepID=UPI002AFF3094|nr:hypothetical protein [Paracoccus sp. (in: a-proteobacteria)]